MWSPARLLLRVDQTIGIQRRGRRRYLQKRKRVINSIRVLRRIVDLQTPVLERDRLLRPWFGRAGLRGCLPIASRDFIEFLSTKLVGLHLRSGDARVGRVIHMPLLCHAATLSSFSSPRITIFSASPGNPWVRLWRVLGEAVERHQAAVLWLEPAAPVRRGSDVRHRRSARAPWRRHALPHHLHLFGVAGVADHRRGEVGRRPGMVGRLPT